MSFKFEKLNIWKDAMTLGEEINTLVDTFPKKRNVQFINSNSSHNQCYSTKYF